jgi:hypothetical protein
LSHVVASRGVCGGRVALLMPRVARDPTAKNPVVASSQGATALDQEV